MTHEPMGHFSRSYDNEFKQGNIVHTIHSTSTHIHCTSSLLIQLPSLPFLLLSLTLSTYIHILSLPILYLSVSTLSHTPPLVSCIHFHTLESLRNVKSMPDGQCQLPGHKWYTGGTQMVLKL